ncbi:MAG: PEGA domain-containing protein [Polyangiaceae bacterium]
MKARIALAALLASTCFSASFTALAAPDAPQGEAAVGEASQHFTKGVQLFKEWSFDAALAEFRRAYQLAPSYRVLYNIAQVYFELHNYVDSLKFFRQYLTEGGTEIPPERRAQVEADIRKLEGRVGYLEVSANLEGVQVSVDEVPVGTLPLRTPILVNPGVRRVSATKVGYAVIARNVTVAGGDHTPVQHELTELPQVRAQREEAKRQKERPPERPRTAMWVSLAATGALGVTAGVFGILSNSAKKDFESQLSTFPNTKDQIDEARSRASLHSGLADGFAAAAVVAGGFTLAFALTHGSGSSTPPTTAAFAPPPKRLSFAPTLNGVVAVGEF